MLSNMEMHAPQDKNRRGFPQRFFKPTPERGSALTGFVALLGLVDHVDPALTAHNLTVAVTRLQRTQRVFDLHGHLHIAATCALNLVPSCESGEMVGGTGIEPVATTMST